ncbi:MAG: hypothetical protein WEG56_04360 [Chloroflexota bacterium]
MRRGPEMRLRPRTLVVSILVAALVGAAAHALATPPLPPAPQARVTAAETEVRPRRDVAGMPVDFAHSRAGAVAAAASYVRAGQHIYELDADGRDAALRTVAADDAEPGFLAAQASQLAQLDGVAARGTGPLTWHVSVLATRLDAYRATRARVSIWRVGVLAIDGLTAPLAEYTTVTYELVWEDGDWRIWSETQVPGPSPMGHPEAIPTSVAEWRASLTGFVRYPDADAV